MAARDPWDPLVIPVGLAWFGFLNAYLVLGERTVLVDTGYPFSAGTIRAPLRAHGIARTEVSLILLTHGHLDHLGGARAMREALGAPVALHQADAEIARSGRDRPLSPTGLAGRLYARLGPRTAPAFEPDIVHDGDLDLTRFGVAGRTIHTPGHTPGSVSVLLPRCVLAGDLLPGGFVRRTDPRWPYFADDLDELRESIGRVLDLATGPLLVGHRGPLQVAAVARRFGRAARDDQSF